MVNPGKFTSVLNFAKVSGNLVSVKTNNSLQTIGHSYIKQVHGTSQYHTVVLKKEINWATPILICKVKSAKYIHHVNL